MYGNIRMLYNIDPPVADDEIRAAAEEYVRKIGGFHTPSPANEAAFRHAVDEVESSSRALLASLVTTSPPAHRGRALAHRNYIEWVPAFGSGE